MKNIYTVMWFLLLLPACGVKNSPGQKTAQPYHEELKRLNVRYTAVSGDSAKAIVKDYTPQQQKIIMVVNRVDISNIGRLDTVLIPDNFDGQVMQYLPFPQSVPYLENVDKIVLFSYPAQVFAAYNHGWLDYTGPTNMGREHDPTPTGLYFTNWKAEETTSTVNDEWDLKWNFNIANKGGIGWHQYSLPGYPASHSCLRMLEEDAKYMYNWADEWVLKGTDNIVAKGTPVIVFGSYPYGGTKPWWQLLQDPHALDITPAQIEGVVKPHMQEIMKEQQNTEAVKARSEK